MTAERTKRELIAQCRGEWIDCMPIDSDRPEVWCCDCGATDPMDCELYGDVEHIEEDDNRARARDMRMA